MDDTSYRQKRTRQQIAADALARLNLREPNSDPALAQEAATERRKIIQAQDEKYGLSGDLSQSEERQRLMRIWWDTGNDDGE